METKHSKQPVHYPSTDEFVVATITKIQNYGAFASLEEYPGCEGMIHISEISNKWIRNIGDFVRVGKKVVLKVLFVDRERGHIDLSLKSVKEVQRKETLDFHKREQRAKKLIEIAATRLNEKENAAKIIDALYEKFDVLYDVIEKTLIDGEKAFGDAKIPESWKKMLLQVANEYVEIPRFTIKANLELASKAPNGIEIVKNAILKSHKANSTKDVEIKIKYLGAPKYRIEITAPNYKIAEHTLDSISKDITADAAKGQGSVKIIR